MAKRYVIGPVVGSGTLGNPYRAKVADICPAVSVIPSNPDGSPKYNFALSLVSTDNLAAVLAITNLYALPDYALDGRMDGMESNARTGLVQSVEAYDLDGNGLHLDATHDDSDGYRSVLEAIGEQFDPSFNLDHFDVSES